MSEKVENEHSTTSNVAAQLAQAFTQFQRSTAIKDDDIAFTYGQLSSCVEIMSPHLLNRTKVAIFGAPSGYFAAVSIAAVVLGNPFVHLDPSMPQSVLHNIIAELEIDRVLICETTNAGRLPDGIRRIDVAKVLENPNPTSTHPITPAAVCPNDIIYLVATSGTTGKPKCIPVTHGAAYLSYDWRDEYTPYTPEMTVGAYIFAIWEMFRPLRNGATVCLPRFKQLMTPQALKDFLIQNNVDEMLFTPSFLEKTIQSLSIEDTQHIPLTRIVLNGEVVSNELITAVQQKLPHVVLWNLYSICETHDISITRINGPTENKAALSVGISMPNIRAIALDDHDQPCPIGTPGYLHFEGPEMLGPGYINRPEETARRFRDLTINGRNARLYDTGDQGYVDENGSIFVMGRVAHMLKLRGHSIQTPDLIETLQQHLDCTFAIPTVATVGDLGQKLVFYYTTNAAQAALNNSKWGVTTGQNAMPRALANALRTVLPAYCIPSYLVELDAIPIDPVSGKCAFKQLPEIIAADMPSDDQANMIPTLQHTAQILNCAHDMLDGDLSFHDHGGDSLMAVNLIEVLEKSYGKPVDFDLALSVPLQRLHVLLSDAPATSLPPIDLTRDGILLTGATGFLGQRVLQKTVELLPKHQVIYCLVRRKETNPHERLQAIAQAANIPADRIVLLPAALEDTKFNLDNSEYDKLCQRVTAVIHCAAMVNLAVDPEHMQAWSHAGVANILDFCTDANADLRFSSSISVFPDTGGPFPEGKTELFPECSGYGAAKIAAEHQILAANVPAAIVRLPSMYDLDHPNPNDIYEQVIAACIDTNLCPDLKFRMSDVYDVAHFLVGLPMASEITFYNFITDDFITNAINPKFDKIPKTDPQTWLEKSSLVEGTRALIATAHSTFMADADMENATAAQAWTDMTNTPFSTTADPTALITRRQS